MPIHFRGPVLHAITEPSTTLGANFEFNLLSGTPVGMVDDAAFWYGRKFNYLTAADIPLANNTTSWTLVESAAGVYSINDAGFPPYMSFGTNASNGASNSATFGETGMAGFAAPGTTVANGNDNKLYYMEAIFDPHTIASTSSGFIGFADGTTGGAWTATNWVGVVITCPAGVITLRPSVGVAASAGTFSTAAQLVGTAFLPVTGTYYMLRIIMSWSGWAAFMVAAPLTAVPVSPPFYNLESGEFNQPLKIGSYQWTHLGFATTLPTAASVAFAPKYALKNGAGVATSTNIRLAQVTIGRQW